MFNVDSLMGGKRYALRMWRENERAFNIENLTLNITI